MSCQIHHQIILGFLILDTQGLQSPASRTGLSSSLTKQNLLPSPREKRCPITALELSEVNKPQARISGVGISIPLQYIQIPASRPLQGRLHLRFGLLPDKSLKITCSVISLYNYAVCMEFKWTLWLFLQMNTLHCLR
jgi:hypothetical protein